MSRPWHARGVRYASVLLVLALAGWEPFRAHDADVEAGNDAFAAGRYGDAVEDYARARGRVDAGGLDYDAGTAELRASDAEKDPGKKAKLREQGLKDLENAAASAADPRVRAQAAYNRGNALFADDKLEPAIQSYEQALKANPDFEDARLNLELALRHRKKEQQQQQNGQGQGQQGQQGQNQQQGQGGGQGQQQNPQNGQGQGQQGQQGQNPQNGQQGGDPSRPQNGQNGQGQQNQQGNGQNQNQQNQNGQGQNTQNQQQNGNQDPSAQQAPKPKLPNGQGSGPRTQEKTPDDGNLDQLEGESRDQRRNQAARRSNETYHPTEPEDW